MVFINHNLECIEGRTHRLSIPMCDTKMFRSSRPDVQGCSVKKMFLEFSQNSQENTCVRVSFLKKLQAFFIKHLWWLFLIRHFQAITRSSSQLVNRSSHQSCRCSIRKMSLKISQNSQENTCVRVSFLIKLQA